MNYRTAVPTAKEQFSSFISYYRAVNWDPYPVEKSLLWKVWSFLTCPEVINDFIFYHTQKK